MHALCVGLAGVMCMLYKVRHCLLYAPPLAVIGLLAGALVWGASYTEASGTVVLLMTPGD